MFSTSLAYSQSCINKLLTQQHLWPFWFKDGNSCCLTVLPAWLLIEHQGQTKLLTRQANFSYKATLINSEYLPTLKSQFNNSICSDYSISQGFNGGLVGWLSYPSTSQKHQIDFPSLCFGFYDCFIKSDVNNDAVLYACSDAASQLIIQHLQQCIASNFSLQAPFLQLMSGDEYQQAFTQVHDYLLSGDCYQVNLAQAFEAKCQGVASCAFLRLLALSNPPYAAYSHTPFGEILSLSPELFLQFDEDGSVLTRPIKGTRPRKQNPVDDDAQFDDLQHHPKDRAENLMIVDLLRNDLGKHAEIGSVKVPKLFSVESFPQVHHLISDISCKLKAGSHPLDLLFDAFPGGSITGAPKKRAMEIIDELENCQRAIYCGSMGYLSVSGRGQWNITIRTLLKVENSLYAWAGGGIVADSVCESEYQECFNKIGAILQLLEDEFLAD
ncbi:MAG: aminodeoxychorismate synthase component I [Agitococcus sp.]